MMDDRIIDYACDKQIPVKILTKNQKTIKCVMIMCFNDMISYCFINDSKPNKINRYNIVSIEFINQTDYNNFYDNYYKKTNQWESISKKVDNFKNYYMEIIKKLQFKNEEDERLFKLYKQKEEIYNLMFNNILSDKDNLLLNYMAKNDNKDFYKTGNIANPLLLISRSNKSQKDSIKAALQNKISIIEGPPGTGKTTTILSIIANMVFQNQKVVVVSKNNSAINNIVEELDELKIPAFYIRLGNREVVGKLTETIKDKLQRYHEDITNIRNSVDSKTLLELNTLYKQLEIKEEDLSKLLYYKNLLIELKNQYRFLLKTKTAYNFETNKFKTDKIKITKRQLDRLAHILIKLQNKQEINLIEKIICYYNWKIKSSDLKTNGMEFQFNLEEKFLIQEISKLEHYLEHKNIKKIADEIKNIYDDKYIKLSLNNLLLALKDNYHNSSELKIENIDDNKEVVDACINNFPTVLTTVDSILSNFKSFFKQNKKIDCLIIDEASQCDIISALPLLYIAKRIVIVGDSKQLSAIVNVESKELTYSVDKQYRYSDNSFLDTIVNVLNPISNTLIDHYRCDYKIINYCNRFFYNNELVIHNEANDDAMEIVDANKGKYVEIGKKSFFNKRELFTINELINNDISKKFIITPFSEQAMLLAEQYNDKQCGTIHTFQGRGENYVIMSTVLNDNAACTRHIKGNHNLFNAELINVAVSRAKEKFIIVTDKSFFKHNDENMRNLINYIEIYGKEISDTTVCIYDNLYKQMKTYKSKHNCVNPWELKTRELILDYTDKREIYKFYCKFELYKLITDQKYLNANKRVKSYILNDLTHVDFIIYDARINKPVLAIEVDGKYHKDKKQKIRDEMKDKALNHMNIKVLRISSKEAWTDKMFDEKLDFLLDNFK